MRPMLEMCPLTAAVLVCLLHGVSSAAASPPGLGRSLDEVVASDFPHATREDVMEELHEFIERRDLDPETKRSILSGAAERVYNFDKNVSSRQQAV